MKMSKEKGKRTRKRDQLEDDEVEKKRRKAEEREKAALEYKRTLSGEVADVEENVSNGERGMNAAGEKQGDVPETKVRTLEFGVLQFVGLFGPRMDRGVMF